MLPVEEVGVARHDPRTTLDWAVPIAAIVGGVALLLGLIAHPRKADAVFGIGMFCIVAGVVAVVLGYVVPVYLLPALTDNVWVAGDPGRRRAHPAGRRSSSPRRARRRRAGADDRRRRGPPPQAVVVAGARSTATATSTAGPDALARSRPIGRSGRAQR